MDELNHPYQSFEGFEEGFAMYFLAKDVQMLCRKFNFDSFFLASNEIIFHIHKYLRMVPRTIKNNESLFCLCGQLYRYAL
jgi:hypothetical protein